jgi:hypothetical protein
VPCVAGCGYCWCGGGGRSLRTDLPATHLSAKSGHFGAERVPERSQRSPMVQMKAESKTFNMAYRVSQDMDTYPWVRLGYE